MITKIMLVLLGFIGGFCIPFIARRIGKILPATTGFLLFLLPHAPRFPKAHNPLQHSFFKRAWRLLIIHSCIIGIITAGLFLISTFLLPEQLTYYAFAFIWLVLCAAEVDWRFMLLPDCLTIPLLLSGFLFSVHANAITPTESIFGALFAYFIILFCVWLCSFKKKMAFGGGDSKMIVALGSWLGMQGINYTLLLSFFLFIPYIFMTRQRSGAYGPALGTAALITFFVLYSN